jgi:hypothetical protein
MGTQQQIAAHKQSEKHKDVNRYYFKSFFDTFEPLLIKTGIPVEIQILNS